ncbi:hypothetical protein KIPB_007368 [Kipferlia bialata]|uniref:Uncharacterized protein n=1 Tax=Kipferlia bialata TaxID=797122 RepID=A0A391P3S1_9EUKA|nr:hypothetical protein KIPB_007368 [Kipferlia bialata]|eukprot:g7368.t1
MTDLRIRAIQYSLEKKEKGETAKDVCLLRYCFGLVKRVSMAMLGNNKAMVVSTIRRSVGWQTWSIMSLVHNHTVSFTPIPGPPNPEGVHNTQIVRVGGAIVAYGGVLDIQEQRPAWFMAVYAIDSGEWESIPFIEGQSPVPADSMCSVPSRIRS